MKEWLKTNWVWIAGIILIIWVVILSILISKKAVEITQEDILKEQIDSLENQIQIKEIIRDSIQSRIDILDKEIEKVQVEYEEKFNSVINNTPNEDYRQFYEYLNSNRSRLDSCINGRY